MRKADRQTKTVYEHIWRSIAAVVAVVFLLGGTAITLYVDRSMTRQIQERERAYLQNVDTMISNQIASSQQTLNMLLSNPFIVQSIYTGNPVWSTSVYQSGQTVVNAVTSNQAYNSIYVIGGDEIVIKSSRSYQTEETEQRLIASIQQDFHKSLIPWRSQTGGRVNHNLMLLGALEAMTTPNTTGGVLINLDLERMAATVFCNHGSSEVHMVMDGRIIASSNKKAFFTDAASHPVLSEAMRTGNESQRGSYVFSLHNPTYGYTLYSIQDRAALMTPVTTGLLLLMAVISALLTITLLISRRVALHVYTPVKTILIQLQEQLPAGGDPPEEELSDLQRASRSISRTSEMVSAYRRNADTARLSRFIQNGADDSHIAGMLGAELGYTGSQTLVMVLYRAASLEDAHMAADVLQGTLDGRARFLTLDMPGSLLSLVCAQTQVQALPVAERLGQVLALLRGQSDAKVIVAFEQVEGGAGALPQAYRRLVERLRSSVFCSRSAVLTEPCAGALPEGYAQRLYHAAVTPGSEDYPEALERYLEACQSLPAHEAYHQLATLCMRVSEAASSRGLDIAGRLNSYHAVFNALFDLKDYDALTAYLKNLRREVVESITLRKSGEANPLVDRITSYVAAHFDDPALSAAQVAETLGISVSHMSRVISRSLGYGFPELLQKTRLEHAAALLLSQPDASIALLAQQCGFGSASYFTSSFKRKFGMTPSQYRASHLAMGDVGALPQTPAGD